VWQALQVCVIKSRCSDVWYACNKELVEALVRHGASVQIFNWMGETPREAAQEAGHTHVAEFLDGHEHRVLFHEVASETLALSQKRKPPGDFRKPPWSCPRCLRVSLSCYLCLSVCLSVCLVCLSVCFVCECVRMHV